MLFRSMAAWWIAAGTAIAGDTALGVRLLGPFAAALGTWLLADAANRWEELARDTLTLAAGRPAPFAVLARRQTRGKGRLGRAWHSESPVSLYASLAFRPQVEPGRMQTFTLWMGVNLCELLANFTGVEPGIKWPNDIVFDGRKAGGLLTEARIDADRISDLILGVGLNVNPPPRG